MFSISSNNSDSFCHEQDTPVQNNSYSPSLAATNMVLRGSTTTCLSSSSSSALSKTINTSKRKVSNMETSVLNLHAWELSSSQLEIENFRKMLQILSPNQDKPTQKVYDAKWIIYTCWCHRRNVNPVLAPLTVIADFLIYLFSENKVSN